MGTEITTNGVIPNGGARGFKSAAEFMAYDLEKSGISKTDMRTRPMGVPEAGACEVPPATIGYVIPYYTVTGEPAPYYRVRLHDHVLGGKLVKYKQIKGQPNRIYFPRLLLRALQGKDYIVVVEGEKKAECACKNGIPAVGLSGVDSWRNRTIILPAEIETVKLAQIPGQKKKIGIRLPSGTEELDDTSQSTLAEGFIELCELIVKRDLKAVIAFDADVNGKTNDNVQRAAASLAFEMRFRGVPYGKISQFHIPNDTEDKVGFDDYVLAELAAGLDPSREVRACAGKRGTFPRHPNLREWLNKRLQRTKLGRRETHMVAMAVLSDLDSHGKRLVAKATDQLYYFDSDSKALMKVHFSSGQKEEVHKSTFGGLLYRRYGLSGTDQRVLLQLSAQFTGEDPIDEVVPQRITGFIPGDKSESICYQINNGQYVKVSDDPTNALTVCDNGDNGLLFEADHVLPLKAADVVAAFNKEHYSFYKAKNKPRNIWQEVLLDTRIKDKNVKARLFSYIYYLNPWVWRWKGTQLPAEITVGEAGSGKSSLYALRLCIITGEPKLRNSPADLKDWHSSITNAGALHVIDNVKFEDKGMRQRLSDEICRLITEPNPTIEQRKLYSNAEQVRIPVTTTFAFTALSQPFQNVDILQRSVVLEVEKSSAVEQGEELTYDSKWHESKLAHYGGRVGWMANQLFILHLFLNKAKYRWDYSYKALHRLVNFEYALMMMAEIFDDDPKGIRKYLSGETQDKMTDADWALEGLKTFVEQKVGIFGPKQHKAVRVSAGEICAWAQGEEEYEDCIQLTNARKLGRYLQANKHTVLTVCGLYPVGKAANREMYGIDLSQVKKKGKLNEEVVDGSAI